MRQRFFITAAGTGIGKTFITAALARQARALGNSVALAKPIISGFDPHHVEESDTGTLLDSIGLSATQENIERISPWRFAMPLAPSMAARTEKVELNFLDVVSFCKNVLRGPEDKIFIEGVGGVMVPLDDRHTVLDWIEALAIEAILVTGTYLGSLSHTLTALSVLQQRNIPVFAIVLNESLDSAAPLPVMMSELQNWTRLPVIPVLRQGPGCEGEISELVPLFG